MYNIWTKCSMYNLNLGLKKDIGHRDGEWKRILDRSSERYIAIQKEKATSSTCLHYSGVAGNNVVKRHFHQLRLTWSILLKNTNKIIQLIELYLIYRKNIKNNELYIRDIILSNLSDSADQVIIGSKKMMILKYRMEFSLWSR